MDMGKGGNLHDATGHAQGSRQSSKAVLDEYSRHLGQTEEGWMNAFKGGTGHTVLGVLLRRHVPSDALQRAVDTVLAENPRARSLLVLPQNSPRSKKSSQGESSCEMADEHDEEILKLMNGKPAFLVPAQGTVKVSVATGWQPRESMEQLQMEDELRGRPTATDPSVASTDSPEGTSGTQANHQSRVDTCFEIGRRWEPVPSPPARGAASQLGECSCGCGCGVSGKKDVGSDWRRGAVGKQEAEDAKDSGEGKGSDSQTCLGKCSCGVRTGRYKLSMCQDKWLQIVESAMNDSWEEEDEDKNDDSEDEADSEEDFLSASGEVIDADIDDQDEDSNASEEVAWTGEQRQHVAVKEAKNDGDSAAEKQRPYTTMKLLRVTLHRLPPWHSLLLIKVHTMACDRVSAAVLMEEILKALSVQLKVRAGVEKGDTPENNGAARGHGAGGLEAETPTSDHESSGSSRQLDPGSSTATIGEKGGKTRKLNSKSVEDCIPKRLSNKPFWAHGVDIIGYGLGSRRHAYLPFHNTEEQRHSQLIRSGLSRPDTDLLLGACVREETSLHGLLSAAVLKAAATSKSLGKKAEHFGITILLDLRPMLPEELDERTMGFFHSAMMSTHQVSEATELWDLARRCHESVSHSVEKRKQFTDMGDLLMLMAQAMQHPQLTPARSLRTSLLSIFKDTLFEKMETYIESLDIEDYIGCSSVHGVGPCIAVFDSVREDGLHMANVYPAPLFSRSQMRRLVVHTMELLHGAIAMERSRKP